jgi:hypothetical protein
MLRLAFWLSLGLTLAASIYFGGPLGFYLSMVAASAVVIGVLWALIIGGIGAVIDMLGVRNRQ